MRWNSSQGIESTQRMHFWIGLDLMEVGKLLRSDFFSRIDVISSLLYSTFAIFSLAKLTTICPSTGITLRAVGLYESFLWNYFPKKRLALSPRFASPFVLEKYCCTTEKAISVSTSQIIRRANDCFRAIQAQERSRSRSLVKLFKEIAHITWRARWTVNLCSPRGMTRRAFLPAPRHSSHSSHTQCL